MCQEEEAWISAEPAVETAGNETADDILLPEEPLHTVDWIHGTVSALGEGTVPENAIDRTRASAMAARSAVMQARRELYVAVKKMNLDGSRTVARFFAENPDNEFRVSSLIRNSKISDRRTEPDGSVSVRASIGMGGKLLEALVPRSVSFQSAVYESTGNPGQGYTGLVVDARSVDVKPGLLPRILDPNGQEVYGPASMNRKTGLEIGPACYVTDASEAVFRVGASPLTVTAMDVSGKTGVDIRVGPADAARIQELGSMGTILQKCRVAVLVSPETFDTPEEKIERIGKSLTGEDRGPVLIPVESIKNHE